MSFWYGEAPIPTNFTAAGGMAGLEEISDASYKQMQFVDNTTASYDALYQAYDDRIAAIRGATGQAIENPLKIAEQLDFLKMQEPSKPMYLQDPYDGIRFGPAMPTNSQKEASKFHAWLQDMEKRFPEQAGIIKATTPVERDAEALARHVEEKTARLMASRPGAGTFLAALYGGFKGSLRDPIQVVTLAAGGGAGAGRTVLARIANVALKEALINGTVEAALQPSVQAWREKAGLPHGFGEAATNVLFAAGAAGMLGGAGEALGAGLRRAFRGAELDAAADHAVKTAPLAGEVEAGLSGNVDRAVEKLKEIRDALSPEVRGALDHHDVLAVEKLQLPSEIPLANHDLNMSRALAAAQQPNIRIFEPEIDRARIDRIVDNLLPETRPVRKKTEVGLRELLIRAGGLQDQGGELKAIGLQNHREAFKGRLVRENGRKLDDARLIAAEAGYFNHLYGNADTAVEKSTIADLLDELDTDARRPAEVPDDDGRRLAEADVHELLSLAGPNIPDDVVLDAMRMAQSENIRPLDAFDRLLIERDGHVAASHLPASGQSDALPQRGVTDFAHTDKEKSDWNYALDALSSGRARQVTGLLQHPEIGNIDLVWGKYNSKRRQAQGYGLAKISNKHPEVMADLPVILRSLPIKAFEKSRYVLENERYKAVIDLEFKGRPQTWLNTIYEKNRRSGKRVDRSGESPGGGHSSPPATAVANITPDLPGDKGIASGDFPPYLPSDPDAPTFTTEEAFDAAFAGRASERLPPATEPGAPDPDELIVPEDLENLDNDFPVPLDDGVTGEGLVDLLNEAESLSSIVGACKS